MRKLLKYIPILAAAMLVGCNDNHPDVPADGNSLTLVLNISDMEPVSRAASSSIVSEQINTLRVVIARPDGSIEINRLIYPEYNVIKFEDMRFKVDKDDYKMVYLIANEHASGTPIGDLTYISPDALNNPAAHPESIIDITVSSLPTAQHEPMTAIYRLSTELKHAQLQGSEYVIQYSLKLMRAVTKFTFNIYNKRSVPLTITQISIDGIAATKYHLFPRVISRSGQEVAHYLTLDGPDSIVESGSGEAPTADASQIAGTPFSEYFRTSYSAADIGDGLHTFTDTALNLEPASEDLTLEYYYYESGLSESASSVPYTLYVGFDDSLYSSPLDNLPALPRNTHVVVNLTFTNNDKVLEIETLPYYGVTLNPSFGQ